MQLHNVAERQPWGALAEDLPPLVLKLTSHAEPQGREAILALELAPVLQVDGPRLEQPHSPQVIDYASQRGLSDCHARRQSAVADARAHSFDGPESERTSSSALACVSLTRGAPGEASSTRLVIATTLQALRA